MGSPPTPPTHETATLERLVARLEEAAGRLRGGELSPDEAGDVVEQCAQAAGQAVAELERLARAAASEVAPTQDRLL
jgi:hypothetical protein